MRVYLLRRAVSDDELDLLTVQRDRRADFDEKFCYLFFFIFFSDELFQDVMCILLGLVLLIESQY